VCSRVIFIPNLYFAKRTVGKLAINLLSISTTVSVVSLAGDRVAGTVAGGEECGSVVCHKGEQEHDSRTSYPSQLSQNW
jgi:hypothetical protein